MISVFTFYVIMSFTGNPVNVTVENGGIKKSDTSFLFPTDDIDTNERVGQLFNLALGGAGSEAPLTSKNEHFVNLIISKGELPLGKGMSLENF